MNEGTWLLEGYFEDFFIMVRRLWFFEEPQLKVYTMIRYDINRN